MIAPSTVPLTPRKLVSPGFRNSTSRALSESTSASIAGTAKGTTGKSGGTRSAVARQHDHRTLRRLREGQRICPRLAQLLQADPVRASEKWTAVCKRLEGLGATVESCNPGEAYFVTDSLKGLFDGTLAGAARTMGPAFDLGAAPSRFGAGLAAARAARMKAKDAFLVAPPDLLSFLGAHPVAALRARLDAGEAEEAGFVESLENLGVETLAQLAWLGPDRLADRFGGIGLRALRLARGEDDSLRPAAPQEDLHALIELPGRHLRRALGPRARGRRRAASRRSRAEGQDDPRAAALRSADRRWRLGHRADLRPADRLV